MGLEDNVRMAKDQAKEEIKQAILKKIPIHIRIIIIAVIVGALMLFFIIMGIAGGEEGDSASQSTQGMTSASSSSWEQFKKFVLVNEGGTRVDENGNKDSNGAYYIVENDSQNNPTVGHGLCLKAGGSYLNVESFSNYDIDSKKLADDYFNGTYGIVPVEICDAIWNDVLYSKYQSVVSQCQGLSLTEYQLYALTDVQYRRGNIDGFKEKYNALWNDGENSYKEDTSSETYSMDTLYSFFNNGFSDTKSGVYTRKKRQWLLFKYGYYETLGEYWEKSVDGGTYAGNTEKDYIIGTLTSEITGKTFTILNQNGVLNGSEILDGLCNRAAGAIILSGYYDGTTEELIKRAQDYGAGFPYDTSLYAGYGLTVTNASSNISNYQQYISSELLKGNYILIHFKGNGKGTNVTSKSGNTWCYGGNGSHWISIIGYRVQDGVGQFFPGDPGWGPYGNTQWFDLDEFENIKSYISEIYLVSPN